MWHNDVALKLSCWSNKLITSLREDPGSHRTNAHINKFENYPLKLHNTFSSTEVGS